MNEPLMKQIELTQFDGITEGPWELVVTCENETGYEDIKSPNGCTIAQMCDSGGADARLIAAAPSILRELIRYRDDEKLVSILQRVVEAWEDHARTKNNPHGIQPFADIDSWLEISGPKEAFDTCCNDQGRFSQKIAREMIRVWHSQAKAESGASIHPEDAACWGIPTLESLNEDLSILRRFLKTNWNMSLE